MFRVNTTSTQPLYQQLVQQIRHAIDTGMLGSGDPLPGIRTLAQQLVISPNTVIKAYSDLEHAGVIELRHGSGAYVMPRRTDGAATRKVRQAQDRVQAFVDRLLNDGLTEDEIQRLVEAALYYRPARTR
jgi:GntR family transcriptional regulator